MALVAVPSVPGWVAVTAAPGVVAVTAAPGGVAVTAGPWLLHGGLACSCLTSASFKHRRLAGEAGSVLIVADAIA